MASGKIVGIWLGRIAMLAFVAACGRGAPDNLPLEKFTAQQIYQRAEFELSTRSPDEAAEFFGEIERLYPYSQWAKRALIMQAFSYHSDRDYANSRASAQRYLDVYPADGDAAYAQYLVALSYYDQIDDVGRDQELTFQALQALRLVIERYPDSEFVNSAVLKFDLAFDTYEEALEHHYNLTDEVSTNTFSINADQSDALSELAEEIGSPKSSKLPERRLRSAL